MLVQDPISAFITKHDGVVVLAVRGEVDLASASAFKSAIAEALLCEPQTVVIDLLGVRFLGSIGITVLVEAQEKFQDDARFFLVADRSVIGPLAKIVRLDEMFSLHETVAEALTVAKVGKRVHGDS